MDGEVEADDGAVGPADDGGGGDVEVVEDAEDVVTHEVVGDWLGGHAGGTALEAGIEGEDCGVGVGEEEAGDLAAEPVGVGEATVEEEDGGVVVGEGGGEGWAEGGVPDGDVG